MEGYRVACKMEGNAALPELGKDRILGSLGLVSRNEWTCFLGPAVDEATPTLLCPMPSLKTHVPKRRDSGPVRVSSWLQENRDFNGQTLQDHRQWGMNGYSKENHGMTTQRRGKAGPHENNSCLL